MGATIEELRWRVEGIPESPNRSAARERLDQLSAGSVYGESRRTSLLVRPSPHGEGPPNYGYEPLTDYDLACIASSSLTVKPAVKIPVSRLTADRISRMTREEFALYTPAEEAQFDAILTASYDRTEWWVGIGCLTFKLVGALVAIFALVRFIRWAWYF